MVYVSLLLKDLVGSASFKRSVVDSLGKVVKRVSNTVLVILADGYCAKIEI